MFVQISNSRHKKKKPSPGSGTSDTEDGTTKGESEEKTSIGGEESFTEVDLATKAEDGKQSKDNFLGRIGERAAKLKRDSLGKLFGEKESDLKIYTIDQEMKNSQQEKRFHSEGFENRDASEHISCSPKFLNAQLERRMHPKFLNTDLTDRLQRSRQPADTEAGPKFKTVGCQSSPYPPYRLYFIPCLTWNDPEDKTATFLRVALCQASLLSFLVLWIIFAALLFYVVEGSREHLEREKLMKSEKSIIISLGTDLRMIPSNSSSWISTIEKYMMQQKIVVNNFHRQGYTEKGYIWNFPGCLLFSISLITTLGYGFPLPNTIGGCVGALIFVCLGLPMNYLFIRNVGLTLAAKIQVFAKDVDLKLQTLKRRIQNVRKYGESRDEKPSWPEGIFEGEFRPPGWLPFLSPAVLLVYYLIGAVFYGPVRGHFTSYEILLYPCDLSFELAETEAFTRLSYSIFIEISAILISISIALFRVPSPHSVIDPLIHINVLTNTLD